MACQTAPGTEAPASMLVGRMTDSLGRGDEELFGDTEARGQKGQ